ncbi:MAG: hypothetical protein AAGI17_04750 [Planctomycetota bacterium]
MPITAAPGEKYTIRRKILKIFGNTFHVYNADGELTATCKQKAFRLREDMRFYAGDGGTRQAPGEELFSMKARSILDFSTTYDVKLPTGESLGTLRRKGMRSTFVRDEWMCFDDDETTQIGRIIEDSATMGLLRRYLVGNLFPQKLWLEDASGERIAEFRSHFNPFVYRLGVSVLKDHDQFDELFILATGCLLAAIEGRQENSG